MRIIRLKEVIDSTGLARSTIYKYIGEGSFPKPVPLGDRCVGWVESEVQDWILARIEERDLTYQSLTRKGFFITSIIWRSVLNKAPQPMVEFEAAFEDPVQGKGFKYFVRGAYRIVELHYTKTIRPVSAEDKETYLGIIEETAAKVIRELRAQAQAGAEPQGELT